MSKVKSVKKYEMDMCSGSILKKMLLFSLPLMCSSILQLLFNAADIIVVGNFAGDNSLAAVGANTALINLMVNFFMGFSVGANVLVAGYYGAKREEELSKTIHTAIMLSIYSGIILTAVGVLFARQLIIMMQTPEEVVELASVYLRIYFCGMTATMLYNFGSAILRAIGDTKRPLYYLMFSGIINVVLNLIFVIPLKMDVAGVALATVISQCISAFLVIRCMIKEKGSIHLDVKKLGIDRDKFLRILQIGLPASFQRSRRNGNQSGQSRRNTPTRCGTASSPHATISLNRKRRAHREHAAPSAPTWSRKTRLSTSSRQST